MKMKWVKKTKLGCVLVEVIKPSQAKPISTPKHTSSESNEGTTEDKVFSLELKKAGEKAIEAASDDPDTAEESDINDTTDQTFNRGMTKTSNITNDNSTDDILSKLFSKCSEKWDQDMKRWEHSNSGGQWIFRDGCF